MSIKLGTERTLVVSVKLGIERALGTVVSVKLRTERALATVVSVKLGTERALDLEKHGRVSAKTSRDKRYQVFLFLY